MNPPFKFEFVDRPVPQNNTMSNGMSGGNTPSVRVLDGNQPTGSLTDINRFAANAEPTVNFNRLAASQSVTPPSRDAEVRVVVDTAIE
jgi:hypothetical protein